MWRLIATSAVETGGAALAAAAATTTSGHWGRWILRRKLLLLMAVLMTVMIVLRVIKVRMMATIFHGRRCRPRFEHHPVDALKGGQNAADGVGEEGALLCAAKLDAQHSARTGNWPYLLPPLVKGGRRLVVGEGLAHRAVGHHLREVVYN